MDLFLTLLLTVFRTFRGPREANVWEGTRYTFQPRRSDFDKHGNLLPSRVPSYIDISLVTFFIQTKMSDIVRREGWVPVVLSSIQTRKQPRVPKGKLQIHTRVVGWRDHYVEMWHTWSDESGAEIMRSIYVTRVTQKGRKKVTGEDMLRALNEEIVDRPLSPMAARQLDDYLTIREANQKARKASKD